MIDFVKMHANGDHFVLVDSRAKGSRITGPLAARLGDPHRGIGFNQICEMTEGVDAVRLDFWNPDGTTLNACGSATRGAVAYLLDTDGQVDLTVETAVGTLACSKGAAGNISVNMGRPRVEWRDVPLSRPVDTLHLPLDGAPVACSMGNPHCTFVVENVAAIDLETFGPTVEHNVLFPERTNVHLVEVLDRSNIRLRIWERGGGIPEGSGSCSCGAAVNARRRGLIEDHVTVHCDGGAVQVQWDGETGVVLTGRVEPIFEGRLADLE